MARAYAARIGAGEELAHRVCTVLLSTPATTSTVAAITHRAWNRLLGHERPPWSRAVRPLSASSGSRAVPAGREHRGLRSASLRLRAASRAARLPVSQGRECQASGLPTSDLGGPKAISVQIVRTCTWAKQATAKQKASFERCGQQLVSEQAHSGSDAPGRPGETQRHAGQCFEAGDGANPLECVELTPAARQ
jgi:hypothetical protein